MSPDLPELQLTSIPEDGGGLVLGSARAGSLRGLTMPFDDVMACASALAAALGIEIEE